MNDDEILSPVKYIENNFKVLTKADQRGQSQLVPMILKPCQKHWIENRTHRDIILKGRQMTTTTGVLAANSHIVFTSPYQKMAVITHHGDLSEFLLLTVHRFYNNLPPNMRPECDWSSSSRIRFPAQRKDGRPGLDSLIHIDSAESKSIGFGETLNIAHLSEMCRWPENRAEELYAGISQTVPVGGFITIESNPRGRRGVFFDIYDHAKRGEIEYKPFFYPWWWEPDYQSPVKGKLDYNDEEKLLVKLYNLTPEQIQFRRGKHNELKDLAYQEYPENDMDCFLSSDIGVFDGNALRIYMSETQPGRTDGHLTIWKDVIGGEQYVIGVDTALGIPKGDYQVAAVLRVRTNEYVARLRCKVPVDLFAQQVMQLGNRYNTAQIGVEKIGFGHTVIQILMDNRYPNLYYYQSYDSLGEISMSPGWSTDRKSKPIMLSDLSAAIRAHDIIIWSENFVDEASRVTWDGVEMRKIKKASGGYDDELDAVMIAMQIRESAPFEQPSQPRVVSYARL
mgnify:CR=1 FL=1